MKNNLIYGNRFFAVDPPASYTTNYNLKKYNDGDDPGAAALNEDKDIIDTYIFSSSIDNTTATVPLAKSSSAFVLQYDINNLKLTGNSLTSIQGIATSSAPNFQSIYVADNIIGGTDPDTSVFFFTGSTYQAGSINLSGSINLGGDITVWGNTTMTGSTYISESLITRKLIVNPMATPADAEELPSGYDVLISGSLIVSGTVSCSDAVIAQTINTSGNVNIHGYTYLFESLYITQEEQSYSQKFHVEGDAAITTNTTFGTASAHEHNVTGSLNVSGSFTRKGKPLGAYHGALGLPPTDDVQNGDTYWDSGGGTGQMYLNGAWRQIT